MTIAPNVSKLSPAIGFRIAAAELSKRNSVAAECFLENPDFWPLVWPIVKKHEGVNAEGIQAAMLFILQNVEESQRNNLAVAILKIFPEALPRVMKFAGVSPIVLLNELPGLSLQLAPFAARYSVAAPLLV